VPGLQEATELFPGLVLRRSLLRGLKVLCAALGSHSCGEVGELLRLQGEKLVAGLRCRKAARCRLARRHQGQHLGAVGIEIADDASLHAQRILQGRDGVLPARLRVGYQGRTGLAGVDAAVGGLERVIDLLDVESDVLRLREKLLGTLDRGLKLLQRRIWQAREIARLIESASALDFAAR